MEYQCSWRGVRGIVCSAFTLAVLGACGGGGTLAPVLEQPIAILPDQPYLGGEQPVSYTPVDLTGFSPLPAQSNYAVNDDAAWKALWKQSNLSGDLPPSAVDFSTQTVAAIFAGPRPQVPFCSQYSLRIDGVGLTAARDAFRVYYRLDVRPPPAGTTVCTALYIDVREAIRFDNPQHLPVTFVAMSQPASATPVQFTSVDSSDHSGIDSWRTTAVNDESAWKSLWSEHSAGFWIGTPLPPAPEVAFSKQSVAAIFSWPLGKAPLPPCPILEIVSVDHLSDADAFRVNYRQRSAISDGIMCPAVVPRPGRIVRFDNPTHRPVVFAPAY